MSSATQRTLRKLRADGYTCGIVEKWIPQAKRRVDLFGIIDIVAIKPGETLGVQSTTYSNVSAHVKKAKAEPKLADWLSANNRFQVWGWKKGARGEKALRVVEINASA